MDLREWSGKAAERIKSVFSKDNRFFYGNSNANQQEGYQEDLRQQAPTQGNYPNAYQPSYQPNPYPPQQQAQGQPYPPMSGQQPPYQPAPFQPQQGTYPPQQQQPVYQPQPAHEQYAPQRGVSPQQIQLQPQQTEQPVRNRRAAQHMEAQTQDSNILPFPGSVTELEKQQMDAYVVNITNINGCRQAMTCLRKGQCTLVVMDQLIDKAEVRRYVDMLNGACFALGGTMTRLSLKVGFYILAPNGMMVYTDLLTASANAPRQPTAQQPVNQQQPGYQPQPAYPQQQAAYPQQPQQQAGYQQDYAYQQPAPQRYAQQQPYQQAAAEPQQPYYQQQANPYAPPMNQQPQQDYVLDPYDAQRYAQ